MAENKHIWDKLSDAKPRRDEGRLKLAAALVTAAREVLKALFFSGSQWDDLRIAGNGRDSRSRRPTSLVEVLFLLLSGQAGKLFFFDAKAPDKAVAVDRKTLLNPAFLASLQSSKPVEEPVPPSDYQRLMNRLNGWYQKEMDDYQLQLALYEVKKLQHQRIPGRKLPPEAIRDLSTLPDKLPQQSRTAEQEAIAQQAAALQALEEQSVAYQAQQLQAMEQQVQAQQQAQEEAAYAEAPVAEKRCREALHVLGRNDAQRHEIIDAVAVLLTCYILASRDALGGGVEFFDKAVGKVKNQPPFTEMTRDPEGFREKVMESADRVLDQPGDIAEKMQDIVFHRYVKIALAMKDPTAPKAQPVRKEPAQKSQPAPHPAAPVPVRVLTKRLNDDK